MRQYRGTMPKRFRGAGAGLLVALCLPFLASCAGRTTERVDADTIAGAWKNYRLGEFDTATRKFEAVIEQSEPGSPNWQQGMYGLASVCNLRRPNEDREMAETLYRELIDVAPDSDMAAWSMLALARMKHLVPVGEDPDYEEVRQRYRSVMQQFPGHLAGDEAFIYLQATYAATMDPSQAQKALDALKKFVKERPDSGFRSAAYSLQSVCYEILNRPEERLEAELNAFDTAEVDPANPFQDNAWRYWMLGTLAEFNAGDFNTARKYYGLLIEEYPTDIRKYAAEQALERMNEIEERIRKELAGET